MHVSHAYPYEYIIKIRFFYRNTDHWLQKKSSKVLNPLVAFFVLFHFVVYLSIGSHHCQIDGKIII